MKTRVEELENAKRSLETKLLQHDKDRESEKQRVQALEEEITTLNIQKEKLEGTIREMKAKAAKIPVLERRVDWLENNGALAFKDNRIRKQGEQMEVMHKYYENQFEIVFTQNKELKDELRKVWDTCNDTLCKLETMTSEFNKYKATTDDLVIARKQICLSQLFGKWMEAIYWDILPAYFPVNEAGNIKTDYAQPHLSKIEKEIQTLYPADRRKRKQLTDLWREKKEEMGFDYVHFSMDESQRSRFMESTYRNILPDYFYGKDGKAQAEVKPPCLHDIEKDIKSTYPTKEKQNEKITKWKETLEEIGSEIVEFMEKKMKQRNRKAHPDPLEEEELREIAETIPYREKLYVELVMRQLKSKHSRVWREHVIPLQY